MKSNYKSYWRKTGLKGKWGDIYLERISFHNPKKFLEIGVFCGVTARNTCDLLYEIKTNDIISGIDSVKNFNSPVLLFHCKDDERIPISHSNRINKFLPKDSKFIIYDNCDHAKGYEENTIDFNKHLKGYYENSFN